MHGIRGRRRPVASLVTALSAGIAVSALPWPPLSHRPARGTNAISAPVADPIPAVAERMAPWLPLAFRTDFQVTSRLTFGGGAAADFVPIEAMRVSVSAAAADHRWMARAATSAQTGGRTARPTGNRSDQRQQF